MGKEEILQQYTGELTHYQNLAAYLERSLKLLLGDKMRGVNNISARVKDQGSLAGKLIRNIKNNEEDSGVRLYSSITDIHDVVGVRIITYFEDHAHKIEEVLKSNFAVDEKGSGDRAHRLKADQFGYKSIHYICSLKPDRHQTHEHQELQKRGTRFEIQVRSVLQHAWAEIEHDIGYKSNVSSSKIKRDFAIIAGMLELVDREFMRIRDVRKQAILSVDSTDGGFNKDLDEVSINANTIRELAKSNFIAEIDSHIATGLNGTVTSFIWDFPVERYTVPLSTIGISSIGSLLAYVTRNRERIIKFGILQGREYNGGSIPREISLFYMALYVLGQINNRDMTANFYRDLNAPFGQFERIPDDFRIAQSEEEFEAQTQHLRNFKPEQ